MYMYNDADRWLAAEVRLDAVLLLVCLAVPYLNYLCICEP
jgi:hypothetical protein